MFGLPVRRSRQAPHRCDIVLGCVRIITDDDIRGSKERCDVEQRTVSRDGDSPSGLVVGFGRRVEIVFRSDEPMNIEAVLLFGLLNHLIDELAGRAKKDNALLVLPPKPLPDQETDECLAAPGRQLQCDVGGVLRLRNILLHHLSLMQQYARNLASGQLQKDFFGAVGRRLGWLCAFEGQCRFLEYVARPGRWFWLQLTRQPAECQKFRPSTLRKTLVIQSLNGDWPADGSAGTSVLRGGVAWDRA